MLQDCVHSTQEGPLSTDSAEVATQDGHSAAISTPSICTSHSSSRNSLPAELYDEMRYLGPQVDHWKESSVSGAGDRRSEQDVSDSGLEDAQ